MKKFVLILTIISIIGMAFASAFDYYYNPLTITELFQIFAESEISFNDTINSFNNLKERISDTITDVSSYPSAGGGANSGGASREDLEKDDFDLNFTVQSAIEWLWKKIRIYTALVLDFFTLLRLSLNCLTSFLLDTLQSVTSVIEICYKLFRLSGRSVVPDIL